MPNDDNNNDERTVRTTCTLPADVHDWLIARAETEQRTIANMLRVILTEVYAATK